MRIRPEFEENGELQFAPMVDIIFLLIVFFLCASTFNPAEAEFPVPLGGGLPPTGDEVEIEILADGGVVINEREYDSPTSPVLPQLRALLARLVAVYEDVPVIIAPDSDVSHGRVVEVLNACAASQATNISFYAR